MRRPFSDQPMPHQMASREALSPAERAYAGFGPYKATSGERIALVPVLVVVGILSLALAVHLLA